MRQNQTKRSRNGNQSNLIKEKKHHPSRVKSSDDYRGAHNNVGEDMRESRNEAETFQKEEAEPTPFD